MAQQWSLTRRQPRGYHSATSTTVADGRTVSQSAVSLSAVVEEIIAITRQYENMKMT
jgi:hypothetical protein